ncbi:MAG: hypothetical protein II961_00505 [Candidatus Riflebacteria bacterium]|nr:hypothetical protein [Candidatus Riflebacteria bacterium]
MPNTGWFDIKDDGMGKIMLTLNGKKVPLRFTVSQQERLLEFNEQREKRYADENENAKRNFLKDRAEDDLDICYIALNPKADSIDFDKDEINSLLDIDQQRLIASIWMDRKVLTPSFTSIEKDLEKQVKLGNV